MKIRATQRSELESAAAESPLRYRRSLRVHQHADSLNVEVSVPEGSHVKSLWLRLTDDEWVSVSAFRQSSSDGDTSTFAAELIFEEVFTAERRALLGDLFRIPDADEDTVPEAAEGTDDARAGTTSASARLNLFIDVTARREQLESFAQSIDLIPEAPDGESETGAVSASAHEEVDARISLGQFAHTELGTFEPVIVGGDELYPYVTRFGNLVVAFNKRPRRSISVRIEKAVVKDGVFRLRGRMYTRHAMLSSAVVHLTGRYTGRDIPITTRISRTAGYSTTHYGKHRFDFEAEFPVAEYLESAEPAVDDLYDAWLHSSTPGYETERRTRIGRSRYLVRRATNEGWDFNGPCGVLFSPYYTAKAKRLSVRIEVFERSVLTKLLKRTQAGLLTPRRKSRRRVWLVGEMEHKAQDNGLAFFKYLRQNHPEIDAYYVIDPDAADVANLVGLDHIVAFRSQEHLDLTLEAERVIGTHHPDYLYPSRSRRFVRAVNPATVFLQHGVIALKRVDALYGKRVREFSTDAFIVSSESEKSIIVQEFGYPRDEVHVTGLARYDSLFRHYGKAPGGDVLIVPTWRSWLQDEQAFAESEYLEQWTELCSSPELHAAAKRMGGVVKFYIHQNMRQFRSYFEGIGVEVVDPATQPLQELLLSAGALITDYSSVGWDFSFLDKPVVYFQFDTGRFFRQPPYIDLRSELPGPVVARASVVAGYVSKLSDRGFAPEPEFAARAARFIDHRDTDNCARIFEVVDSVRPTPRISLAVDRETRTSARRLIQRQKTYMPTMKKLFKAVRSFPLDENLVVFEAGLGRQMNDSPKRIYDELVAAGDKRRKVWVFPREVKMKDPLTTVVKRNSPEYFWYLARAKYWVSNQNLPHYIQRLGKGRNLQTWHGTPLKRMFNDLDTFHGRDEGYHDRVSTAIRQWTHLISPSPYATEKFASAFGHSAEVLETGLPRNDALSSADLHEVSDTVRTELGISADKRIVLYAPTFRDDLPATRGRFYYSAPFTFEEMSRSLGEDTILLVRLHVLIKNRPVLQPESEDRIIDVTTYPEINDLFIASDALITDYSSVFFDYSILGRPMVFFPYDLGSYRDSLRGFYLDYEETVPGPVVEHVEELGEALDRADSLASEGQLESFVRRFAPHDDGRAARRVIERFFE